MIELLENARSDAKKNWVEIFTVHIPATQQKGAWVISNLEGRWLKDFGGKNSVCGLTKMHFRSFDEFWPFYVNQHTKASTRRWHFCATGSATLFLLAALLIKWWLLFLAPLFGYGIAWYSHFFIEGNSPVSFGHPLWSLVCDYKMFTLMLTGRMDREIKRLGKRPMLQVS
jgi:hypothetical protein